MIRIRNKEEMMKTLELHKKYLNGSPEGIEQSLSHANLSGADLHGIDLSTYIFLSANMINTNLSSADLCITNFQSSNFSYANLSNAKLKESFLSNIVAIFCNLSNAILYDAQIECSDLTGAILTNAKIINANLNSAKLIHADLSGANLSFTNLKNANLAYANLEGADLGGADLTGANLFGANLTNVFTNEFTKGFSQVCPETGSFIGYKKVRINKHQIYIDDIRVYQPSVIVELEIPEDALRSSATGRKCRCSKAKVLSITNIYGTDVGISEIYNEQFDGILYRVGETVEVKDFDRNRWNECSTGIHFFMTRVEAVTY